MFPDLGVLLAEMGLDVVRLCAVQGHYNYDQYQIIDEMIRLPDLTIAWAVVGSSLDTRKVLLVTAPPVAGSARLATLRRLTEREELNTDLVCPYLASGLDERRSWLALEASEDALSLHDLAEALDARPDLVQPFAAARIVADATAALRVVRMHAPSLPATGIGDTRIGTDGRLVLGHLGEVLTSPRLDEPSQAAELGRWLLRLGGGTRLPLHALAGQAVAGEFRYLSDFMDALERALEELVEGTTGPSRIDVGRWVEEVRNQRPRIAAPALIGELPDLTNIPKTSARSVSSRAPTPIRALTPSRAPASRPSGVQTSSGGRPPPSLHVTPVPAPGFTVGGANGTPTGTTSASGIGSGGMIAGRYRIEGRIADGRMGRVYEATCITGTSSTSRVAIKILQPAEEDPAMLEEYEARFRREARSLTELSHPNIVKIYDFGFDGDCWLAMEYVRGSTLAKLLRAKGHMPLPDVLRISRQLCHALAHAHEAGVIHRDLKPANVILVDDSPGDVRLIDFGLAKHWDGSTDLTDEGTLLGTPHYMSPEQCQGEPARIESDLYALGMLMYRLLTGRMPFEGKRGAGILLAHTTAPVPPFRSLGLPFELPRSIEIIVKRCLEKQPKNRFRSANELDAALESCEQGTPVILPQVTTEQRHKPRNSATSQSKPGEGKPGENKPGESREPASLTAPTPLAREASWSKRKLMASVAAVALIAFSLVGGATSATVVWMMSRAETSAGRPLIEGQRPSRPRLEIKESSLPRIELQPAVPGPSGAAPREASSVSVSPAPSVPTAPPADPPVAPDPVPVRPRPTHDVVVPVPITPKAPMPTKQL